MFGINTFVKFATLCKKENINIKCINMNNYETVFIMNPVLSEDQMRETVKKFSKFLKDNKAKIIAEENWGLKKMSYNIQNKKTGFYYLIEFSSDDNEITKKIELEYKRDERLMRWITVKLDKYAVEYAENRRKRLNSKTQKK